MGFAPKENKRVAAGGGGGVDSMDGGVVRALASHQCGPGPIPARYHRRVVFVAGLRLAPRVFLQIPRFFSPLNRTSPNSTRIIGRFRGGWLPLFFLVCSKCFTTLQYDFALEIVL